MCSTISSQAVRFFMNRNSFVIFFFYSCHYHISNFLEGRSDSVRNTKKASKPILLGVENSITRTESSVYIVRSSGLFATSSLSCKRATVQLVFFAVCKCFVSPQVLLPLLLIVLNWSFVNCFAPSIYLILCIALLLYGLCFQTLHSKITQSRSLRCSW